MVYRYSRITIGWDSLDQEIVVVRQSKTPENFFRFGGYIFCCIAMEQAEVGLFNTLCSVGKLG